MAAAGAGLVATIIAAWAQVWDGFGKSVTLSTLHTKFFCFFLATGSPACRFSQCQRGWQWTSGCFGGYHCRVPICGLLGSMSDWRYGCVRCSEWEYIGVGVWFNGGVTIASNI